MSAQWHDKVQLQRALIGGGWQTPDTYGNEYCRASEAPAVYLFLLHGWCDQGQWHDFTQAVVAYVGMTKSLKQRWQGHLVLQELRASDRYIQRWFRPVAVTDLRQEELSLIQKYDPPWNVQGKKRGLDLA